MARMISSGLDKLGFMFIMISISVGLVSCSPAPTAVTSATTMETCAEFNSTIDNNIMEIALSDAEGNFSDKTAMQQGARNAQNNNRLSTIMVNIQLQAQNKCQPRQKPIDPSLYTSQASSCYIAKREHMLALYGSDENIKTAAKEKAALACDFKAWNSQVAK